MQIRKKWDTQSQRQEENIFRGHKDRCHPETQGANFPTWALSMAKAKTISKNTLTGMAISEIFTSGQWDGWALKAFPQLQKLFSWESFQESSEAQGPLPGASISLYSTNYHLDTKDSTNQSARENYRALILKGPCLEPVRMSHFKETSKQWMLTRIWRRSPPSSSRVG